MLICLTILILAIIFERCHYDIMLERRYDGELRRRFAPMRRQPMRRSTFYQPGRARQRPVGRYQRGELF